MFDEMCPKILLRVRSSLWAFGFGLQKPQSLKASRLLTRLTLGLGQAFCIRVSCECLWVPEVVQSQALHNAYRGLSERLQNPPFYHVDDLVELLLSVLGPMAKDTVGIIPSKVWEAVDMKVARAIEASAARIAEEASTQQARAASAGAPDAPQGEVHAEGKLKEELAEAKKKAILWKKES
jgi:hypothetical protein